MPSAGTISPADDDDVTRRELLDGNLLDAVSSVAVGDPRSTLDQQPQLTPRPAGSPRFEGAAAGHHQRHDRARELLAEDQGAGNRHQGDGIHADVALEQAAQRLDREWHQDDGGTEAPDDVGPARLVEEPEGAAGHDRRERDNRENAVFHGRIVPAPERRGRGNRDGYTPVYTPRRMDPSNGGRKIPAMTRTTTATEAPLTDRQREVVALIAAGCSNDEVGRSLGISSRTAKAHSDALRMKLGVARRRQIPAAFRLLTGEDPYVPALVRLRPPRSR